MKKLPRRCVSKRTSAPNKGNKISKNMQIPADKAKAPVKSRRAAMKMMNFLELEDENRESMDSGFGETQGQVNHRYPTRARMAALARQNDDRIHTKSSSAKPAEPKRHKHPPDVDKENDGSAANGAQPRRRTSSNRRRSSGLPASRPVSQNPATLEDLNSSEDRLSLCSSDNWIDHIRWLQPRRDIGLWIECSRKGCGKWRYAEAYHDPLDVPKTWFCEMNPDARFADCSIPQEETPEAEVPYYIENAYNAGSIVWAKVNGYPWWPAMVDDCPDFRKYWDIRGSSTVPYKYHVKFFNEMKIAWIPVRNLKPYAENPRRTFLKKTVFRRKDYSNELDSACEVTNQALPLKILERLERFSWASLISGSLCEENEGLAPDEGPVKKNKTTGQQTINVKSRVINVETDSTINTRPLISAPAGVPIQFTIGARRSVSCSESPCRDKVSFLEPNELFKGNSSDRSKVDNSNIDDAAIPSPASKATQSTQEKKNAPSNEWCPKRVTRAEIAAKAQEIRNTRALYAMKARNARAARQKLTTSNPSSALHSRELSPPDRSSVNLRSSVDAPADIVPTVSDCEDRGRFSPNDIFAPSTSRTDAFACTEEPAASPWEPIVIDLTGSSTDFEGDNDRRESPDYPSHAETRDNSQQPNPTLASTSNGLGASFGSIESNGSFRSLALSSEPERDEMGDRCPSSCGMSARSVDLEVSDSSVDAAASVEPDGPSRERFFANIFAASSPRTEVRHSRSASRESGVASFFAWSSFGEGSGRSGRNSEQNFSAGGSETNSSVGKDASTSSSRETILIDLTDSSTDFEGYYDRREYPDFSSQAETRAEPASSEYVLNTNVFSLGVLTRSRSSASSRSSDTVVPSSQPEMDRAFEQSPRFPGLCSRPRDSASSTHYLPTDNDFGSPGHFSSDRLFELITIDD